MSVQNAATFLARLDQDSELQARVTSKDDAVRVAAELNTPFTLEELEQAQAERAGDLSPDEMKNVAGGRFKPL